TLWHGVSLLPDNFAAEQVALVTHVEHQPVRKTQQIPIGKPRLGQVDKRLPLSPRLDVGGIFGRESILLSPESAVYAVLDSPVHGCVVCIADVEPEDAFGLEFRQETDEHVRQGLHVFPRVLFDARAQRCPLTPIRWTRNDDVDALVGQMSQEIAVVPDGNLVEPVRPEILIHDLLFPLLIVDETSSLFPESMS